MPERVVLGRRLRQAGEQRGLREGDVLDVLVEVRQRGGLDADRVVAVEDAVEVVGEDLVLGVRLLVLDGQVGLLDLPVQRLVVAAERQDLHQLHGDRRGALQSSGTDEIVQGRTGQAHVVDAVVLVEALVFDRDRRLLELVRDLRAGDQGAVLLAGHDPQQVPVAVVDRGVLAERLDVEMRGLLGDLLDLVVEREPGQDHRWRR